jgi:hypothetical protein
VLKPGVVAYAYNSSTRESKAGGLRVQPRLCSETLSQKTAKGKMVIYCIMFILIDDAYFQRVLYVN